MGQVYWYYIPLIIQRGDRIGLAAKMIPLPGLLNSLEAVGQMIELLLEDVYPEGPPEDMDAEFPPLLPIGWTLITAQRGPSVQLGDNGSTPEPEPEPPTP